MPLQIRRGTAAERNTISAPLAIGELLYVTDQGKLYIGDGTSLGDPDSAGNPGQGGKGLIITGFTSDDAQDAMAVAFANGYHVNVVFTYDDNANSISAGLDLSNYVGNVNVEGTVRANSFKGSIFADDSTLLVDAVNASIPYSVLSGAPTALSNFSNDLGYITSAQLLDGTISIDVNNTGDLQGSVFGDDSTLLVDAVNSTIPASVVSGDFKGNVIGNDLTLLVDAVNSIIPASVVSGDFNGNIVGDDFTLLVDAANSTIPASVISGAFNGNIVGDDFTLLVNAATSTIPASVVSGTFNGSVVGGTISGDIVTNFIRSSDSSLISFDSPVQFNTAVRVQSNLIAEDEVNVISNDANSFPLSISSSFDNDQTPVFTFRRSRGTFESPSALINQDRLGSIVFSAYDGTTYSPAATIQGRIEGAVSAGITPGQLRFLIKDSTGAEIEAATMNSFGNLFLYARNSAASPLQIFSHHDDGTNASNVILVRSRGTTTAPTSLVSGDPVFDFAFAGHDGTTNRGVAQIRVTVDDTVSTGVVPGRFDFFTTNSSGTSGSRVQISSTKTTFNNIPVLPSYANETAADAAIGGSGSRVNGMMYYDSGVSKIKAVAGGVWVAIH